MVNKSKEKAKFLMYKNKPLVRCKDTIYYGNLYDGYVVKLKIKNKKTFKDDIEVATSVSVQLMSTDPDINAKKKIIKTSEKESLYLAIDIAEIWLSRILKENAS